MKVKFAIYVSNGQDGSANVHFFKNEEGAEKYASRDDCRFEDDVRTVELEFDNDGNLLTGDPVHWME